MVPQITLGVSPVIRLALALGFSASVMGFDMTLNSNLAVYWGQNSYGATNPGNKASWQQGIEFYCGDDTVDTFPVAFLNEFYSTGNLPTIDLANTCSTVGDPLFPGTNLPNCGFLASGIETCQKAGKIITLSIGGASGGVGFATDSEGEAYAKVIWDLFLGGSSSTRPFGNAKLDGVDMDIEGGGQAGYIAFLTALRKLMDGGDKQYYITAAPQCPFPDAYIGTTLNKFGFDAVYVQFYNNFCSVSNFANSNDFDFSAWDNWAKTMSPNKNVKVYIGAPGSSTAANNGYVSASELATIVSKTKSQYSSFGGVMLWDVSQAYANDRYDRAVKNALTGSSGAPPTTPSASVSPSSSTSVSPSATPLPPSSPPSSSSSSSPTPSFTTSYVKSPTGTATSSGPPATSPTAGAGCAGAHAFETNIIYLGGDEAVYQNQLWKAKWWTEGALPGGAEGVWTRVGSC